MPRPKLTRPHFRFRPTPTLIKNLKHGKIIRTKQSPSARRIRIRKIPTTNFRTTV